MLRVDAIELVAQLLGPELRVRPAAELADDEARDVADERRVDVLVGVLDLRRCRAMDAALRAKAGGRRRLVIAGRDIMISAT